MAIPIGVMYGLVTGISDAITRFCGSARFVLVHVVWFTVWIVWNAKQGGFDPYPFSLLTMLVSLEAIFLTSFVLIERSASRAFEVSSR